MLTIPKILDTSEFLKEEGSIKWDVEKYPDYFTYNIKNEKLLDAICLLNHKATLGIVAACSEWVFWRFSKERRVDNAINSIEAFWLAIVDKRYLLNWKYTSSKGETMYANILWIIFNNHLFIRDNYKKGDYQMQFRVVNMIMLARHITPNQKMFDTWLNDCLKRSLKLFPAQYDRWEARDNKRKYSQPYDSTSEPPILREFYFEPGFDYQTADIHALLKKFVDEIDISIATFFFTPEKMLEQGFEGTPYKYEPK